MKIKKVAYAALLLSLSMSILACVPENKISASDKDRENPIEVVCSPKTGDNGNHPATIIRDNETGVEYIYIYNNGFRDRASSCAIYPRLDKDGKPVVFK